MTTSLVPLREEVYQMLENIAKSTEDNKNISLNQNIKGLFAKSSVANDRPVQIFQMQTVNISSTINSCVNMLRVLDEQEVRMVEAEPVKVLKRGDLKPEIIMRLERGEKPVNIAKQLDTGINYVYQVSRAMRKEVEEDGR